MLLAQDASGGQTLDETWKFLGGTLWHVTSNLRVLLVGSERPDQQQLGLSDQPKFVVSENLSASAADEGETPDFSIG